MTLSTADLLAEAEQFSDEDQSQEYLTLRLEGKDSETARLLSRRAHPRALASRGIRNPLGEPAALGYYEDAAWAAEKYPDTRSLTLDHRTDEERDAAEAASEIVRHLLENLDETERSIIVHRFGIERDPLTPSDTARALGVSISKVERTVQRLRKRTSTP